MAKCKRCGKKGLFLKVNSDGLCKACEIISVAEQEKNRIEIEIQENKNRLSQINVDTQNAEILLHRYQEQTEKKSEEFKNLVQNRDSVMQDMVKEAEAKALNNLHNEIQTLEDNRSQLLADVKKLSTSYSTMQVKYETIKTKFDSYKQALNDYTRFHSEAFLTTSFDDVSTTVQVDLQCMTIRQLRKMYTENQKLINECFNRYSGRYTTKVNAALYQLMTIALEAELQNILVGLKYGKIDDAVNNIRAMCEKYLSIAASGNQSIEPTIKKFVSEAEVLFIEAVKIEYEYYVQKERIKEEQRAIREQMKQEAEERKALEQERKRIEKESQKYHNEIENIKEQLRSANEQQEQLLKDRIAELEAQLNKVEDKKEQIINLENGKAGYVYIVSNIGSFGDDVYKIGMTRRLEPMDRINELGNASVPFPFDVHGMIFSDDAVSLEHELHTVFNNNRVNKINLRKEFFKVSLDDIEKIVDERCPSAEFTRTALAEQYRQSVAMNNAADELSEEDIRETVQ